MHADGRVADYHPPPRAPVAHAAIPPRRPPRHAGVAARRAARLGLARLQPADDVVGPPAPRAPPPRADAGRVMAAMAEVFPDARELVDVGAGSGAYAAAASRRGARVVALERS